MGDEVFEDRDDHLLRWQRVHRSRLDSACLHDSQEYAKGEIILDKIQNFTIEAEFLNSINVNQIYATYSMMTGLLSTIAVGILLLLIVSVIIITIISWFPDDRKEEHHLLEEVRNPFLRD